jgi:acylphosphatase
MTTKCIKAYVSGRVQGVFFRETTRRQALSLGISGHAINLDDGRVEVLACGEESKLLQLETWLHQGPEYALVTDVQVMDITLTHPSGFVTG